VIVLALKQLITGLRTEPLVTLQKVVRISFGTSSDIYRQVRNKAKNTVRYRRFVVSGRLSEQRYKKKGIKILHMFGDSNGRLFFGHVARSRELKKTVLWVWGVRGATAYGLANPNSKSGALQFYEKVLRKVPRNHYLLFQLGEGDCGKLIWLRAKAKGTPVEEQLQLTLSNYRNYISSLLERGYSNILLAEAPPPSNEPIPVFREVHEYESLIPESGEIATQKDITSITSRFNSALEEFCTTNPQLGFLSIEQDIVDSVTGVVDPRFLYKDRQDHHLDPAALTPLWVRELKRQGFQ